MVILTITKQQLDFVIRVCAKTEFYDTLIFQEQSALRYIIEEGEGRKYIKGGSVANHLNSVAGKYKAYKNQSV
jgi:hypothetical protein